MSLFRHSVSAKTSVESIPRRFLSSVAPPPVKATKIPSSKSFSRLEALREQLASEDTSIDDFAGEKSVVVRRKAAPRNAKILPKPKWLKVQPADSDNYRRLRQTVRDSGLATVW